MFGAHNFILHSQTRDFTSQLLSSDSLHDQTFKLRKKCDNPDVFDAFLHYVYGSCIRLVPPASPHLIDNEGTDNHLVGMESTPNTSLVSVDEDDLTEEYDMFGVINERQEDWLDGDMVWCMNGCSHLVPIIGNHVLLLVAF